MCLSRRLKLVAGAGKLPPVPTLEEAQRNFGEANEPLPRLGLPSLASIALLARAVREALAATATAVAPRSSARRTDAAIRPAPPPA